MHSSEKERAKREKKKILKFLKSKKFYNESLKNKQIHKG